MLLSIFTPIYETIIGPNNDFPEYRANLFDSVGLITLIIAIVFLVIFYLVLGRWKEIWYTTVHWAVTIFILAAVCFIFPIFQGKDLIGGVDGYLVSFSLINALYGVIYFIALSFLFRKFSIFAKQTPRLK